MYSIFEIGLMQACIGTASWHFLGKSTSFYFNSKKVKPSTFLNWLISSGCTFRANPDEFNVRLTLAPWRLWLSGTSGQIDGSSSGTYLPDFATFFLQL